MNIISGSPNKYTYQPVEEIKKKSLMVKIMSPLRKTIGISIGKKLGKINLSKKEITGLRANKTNLIGTGEASSLKISMMNKKGIETHQLDGIFIKSPSESSGIDNKEKKYIVVFFGMGDCYEKHLESMQKMAVDTGANVISFNYRGKMDSSGEASSAKDYIDDGKAFVEYLVKAEAADPEKILLFGHSLGGGVAAKVYQELEHPGYLIPESTFCTLKKAVKHKEGAFTAWIFKKTGWDIDNIEALKNVNFSKVGIIVNRRDPTVHYEKASLYKELKNKKIDKSLEIIKIGRGKFKENLNELHVKTKRKNFNAIKNANSAPKEQSKEYLDLQNKIKKAGWMKFLRHPHQMIIDQPTADEIKVPDKIKAELEKLKTKAGKDPAHNKAYRSKEELAIQLTKLNLKYAEEDKLAYDKMVDIIKIMLNSQTNLAIDT